MRYPKPMYLFQMFPSHLLDYPKWKSGVEKSPCDEAFYEAWEYLFHHPFSECEITRGMLFGSKSVCIQTPECLFVNGALEEDFTDDPLLTEDQVIFYDGCGASLDIDAIGRPFYLLDAFTGMPHDLTGAVAIEIIKRHKKFINAITNS